MNLSSILQHDFELWYFTIKYVKYNVNPPFILQTLMDIVKYADAIAHLKRIKCCIIYQTLSTLS